MPTQLPTHNASLTLTKTHLAAVVGIGAGRHRRVGGGQRQLVLQLGGGAQDAQRVVGQLLQTIGNRQVLDNQVHS